MKIVDNNKYFLNNTNYADINSKIAYLINKYNFSLHKLNDRVISKNDLYIYVDSLYNYSLEKLDVINFLAKKYFVNDPFMIKGYVNEFIQFKYEDIHDFEPVEIKEMYNFARDKFYENVKIN